MKQSEITLLKVEVESDLSDLERIVAEINSARDDIGSTLPEFRDKAAFGSFLHSFYNGVENILKRVAEEVDHSVPVGEAWHRALLRHMTNPVEGVRPPVLHGETMNALGPYLGFRHFFRHSYTFEINWSKLRPLVENAESVLRKVKMDLETFLGELEYQERE